MHVKNIPGEQLPHAETSYRFIFGVLLAYAAAVLAGIFLHPMWRDEMHTWSMASASSSLGDLLHRKAAEGHPDMWYFMVYGIRQLSNNFLSMQLFHCTLAAVTVFLILKYAPFTRLQRVLLISGYFYLFEYAVISRNYAAGVLLITLLLALYRHRQRLLPLMALILFLLAQTNVFGLIFCIAILATWLFEFTVSEEFRDGLLQQKAAPGICLTLVLAGIVYSLYSVIPPPSAYFAGAAHFSFSQLTSKGFIQTAATIWKAWVPVPELKVQFWDTNMLRYEWLQAVLSAGLLFSAALMFVKRPVIFVLFMTGSAGIMAFLLMYYFGYIRHHGHLYILLITCLWLETFYRENDRHLRPAILERYYTWLKKHRERLFLILLSLQCLAGICAMTGQALAPFSAAKMTAQYITEQKLDRFLIAGDQDMCLEPVLGYLNREAFFFSRRAAATYAIYDGSRKMPSPSALVAMADSMVRAHGDTVLLVMNYPLGEHTGLNLKKVTSFEKSIRWDEIYFLYLLCPGEGENRMDRKSPPEAFRK